jgi:hypothetical protein
MLSKPAPPTLAICIIDYVSLKGQYYEIFYPRFFRQTISPRHLITELRPLRKWLRIRRNIRDNCEMIGFRGFNVTAEAVSLVSIPPWKRFQRSQ